MNDSWKNSAKFGCVLGIIGGIVAMIALVICFEPQNDAILTMSLCMLAAVLFFGLAGGFSSTGQWSWRVLMFMCFVTAGIMIGGTMAAYFELWFGAIETVIVVLIAFCALSSSTKHYLERPRDSF